MYLSFWMIYLEFNPNYFQTQSHSPPLEHFLSAFATAKLYQNAFLCLQSLKEKCCFSCLLLKLIFGSNQKHSIGIQVLAKMEVILEIRTKKGFQTNLTVESFCNLTFRPSQKNPPQMIQKIIHCFFDHLFHGGVTISNITVGTTFSTG